MPRGMPPYRGTARRVTLIPGRWVTLPGTTVQVLLHGKFTGNTVNTVVVSRKPDGTWTLPPGGCYCRRAYASPDRGDRR